MFDGFSFGSDGAGFIVIVDNVEPAVSTDAVGSAIPIIENDVVDVVEGTAADGGVASDVGSKKIAYHQAFVAAQGAAEGVVVGVESFGKYGVLYGHVDGGHFGAYAG
ncbi:MAG: hypothetical protein BWX77_00215 [Bacteroidetes bacterium ADurb.Bin090]|nr:MAG: hypothetical protein BWX77_00215 [Bacteroidetes bacterium ADurb.Bin090]